METKKVDRGAVKIGLGAGTIALLCCVSPIVLVLLGLTTVSGAIALGYNLYDNYKIYFISASMIFLIIALYIHFKRKKICTLQGVRNNKNIIIVALFIMILTYIFWFYFTTWLASLAG